MRQRVVELQRLHEHVGKEFGTSEWVLVDQPTIDAFAHATGDHQWVHVDVERAASSPLGSTVAHGYLTLGLVPRLLGEVVRITGVGRGINASIQRAAFKAVVPSGSRVRLQVRLEELKALSGGTRRATWALVMEREAGGPPALQAQVVYLYEPGDGAI